MRIKPAFVTGIATVVAMATVAVVVLNAAPEQVSLTLLGLLWAAMFLVVWGILSTAMLLLHQTITRAVWITFVPALAVVGLLMALHWGVFTKELLGGVIFVTLVLCVIVWRKLSE